MNPQFKQRGAVDFRVIAVLSAVLIFILAIAYFFYGLQPNVKGEVIQKQFSIEKGESFKEVGVHLSEESLINSVSVFKFYAILTGKVRQVQPGSYQLSNAMSIPQIVDAITSRTRTDVFVTIPEGSTLKDIESLLVEGGIISGGGLEGYDFRKLRSDYPFLASAESLEGFLFPDSYFFDPNSSPDEVVKRMLDNFSKKAWPKLSESDDWYNRLILASLLEREVKSFEDRQVVAGILLRRIKIGMLLQVDATISYAKCFGQIRGCPEIKVLRKDIDYDSPYNTYKHKGWTPTPIANPGESAIKAATFPATSQYLYYLSDSETQETHFSKTLEEHNAKRIKYL